MRPRFLALAAMFALVSCNDPSNPSASSEGTEAPGRLAMRIPSEVVAAASGTADSVVLRVIPLSGGSSPLTKTWPLREGEILFETVPAVACSVKVDLINFRHDVMLQGATAVTVLAGRTTSADVSLNLAATGALSVNLRIDGYDPRLSAPRIFPAAGTFNDSVIVSLSRSTPSSVAQYRLEDDSLANSADWTTYTAPFAIRRTAKLFVRSIDGPDTGSFATRDFTIRNGRVVVFENFEIGTSSSSGWNGVPTHFGVSGQRISSGVWGSPSGRIIFTEQGSKNFFGHGFSGRAIPTDSAIDWTKFTGIRLKVNTSKPRTIYVSLNSSLPAFTSLIQTTGGVDGSLLAPAGRSELLFKRSGFAYANPVQPNFPTIPAILTSMQGLIIGTECGDVGGSVCVNGARDSIEIDDIIVETTN